MAKAKPNGLIEQTTGPDPFYRDRDAHLLEVACNGKLSGAAKSIASILAIKYANREKYLAGEKRVAWPSAETLAEILGLNPDTVKDGLKALETFGHHKVDRPNVKGRGRVNGYRFVVKGVANGGEKTPIKNGGEKTPNSQKNGGLKPAKKGVKTPPELIEEQSEGAGARVNAPQAQEQTDVSFVLDDQKDNDQVSAPGDLGAHERAQSPDSIEPDDATLEGWSYAWNSVAFKVLADLPDLAKINIFDPPDLVVACALFPEVLDRDVSRDLPRAMARALPVNSAARSEALGYLRVAMLRLPDLDPATAAGAHQRLLAAIDAAAPPPAKERHSARQVREAANG